MLRWFHRVVLSVCLLTAFCAVPFGTGCNGDKNLLLRVTFPDDAARDRARWVWVMAISPDQGSDCDELILGQAVPGDAGYFIESQIEFGWPAAGEIRGLEGVSAGRKLFYSEAEDAGGEVFLRGCTEAQVGEQEGREVTIALLWLSQPCQSDADCGVCRQCDGQGVCVDDLTKDGDCPVCQECRPAGVCVDQPPGSDSKDDCAADACSTGTCDGSGACGVEAEGTDCGVCAACDGLGLCIQDLTQDQDCPVCQECESAGSCANQSAGAACDDGDSCSSHDACDGAGACASGATDKDTDGDGYYDDRCPGGDDCDDDVAAVNPGATEGPVGDPTCSDGVDNDCNASADGNDPACSYWWDTAFRSRIKLTFGNSARGDFLNLPVRVSLDSNRIDYGKTQDAGQDLRFIDADGATVLAHEIEIWDEGGTSEVWVRVPQIDASDDDFIWLYFDNTTAGDGQSLTTWDTNHIGVWHFGDIDGGSGAVSDSTSSGNAGTVYNGAVFESAGKIGKAIMFDGLDDYAILGNTGFNPSAGTVEVWVNVNLFPALNRSYIFSHFIPGPVSNRAYIYVQPDQLWGTGMGSEFDLVQGSAVTEGNWHYLVITWDGVDARGYLDGSLDFGPTPYADLTTIGDIWVGSWDGVEEFTNGTIDEIRISGIARSADWISAQYSSTMDTFITFGSAETAP